MEVEIVSHALHSVVSGGDKETTNGTILTDSVIRLLQKRRSEKWNGKPRLAVVSVFDIHLQRYLWMY